MEEGFAILSDEEVPDDDSSAQQAFANKLQKSVVASHADSTVLNVSAACSRGPASPLTTWGTSGTRYIDDEATCNTQHSTCSTQSYSPAAPSGIPDTPSGCTPSDRGCDTGCYTHRWHGVTPTPTRHTSSSGCNTGLSTPTASRVYSSAGTTHTHTSQARHASPCSRTTQRALFHDPAHAAQSATPAARPSPDPGPAMHWRGLWSRSQHHAVYAPGPPARVPFSEVATLGTGTGGKDHAAGCEAHGSPMCDATSDRVMPGLRSGAAEHSTPLKPRAFAASVVEGQGGDAAGGAAAVGPGPGECSLAEATLAEASGVLADARLQTSELLGIADRAVAMWRGRCWAAEAAAAQAQEEAGHQTVRAEAAVAELQGGWAAVAAAKQELGSALAAQQEALAQLQRLKDQAAAATAKADTLQLQLEASQLRVEQLEAAKAQAESRATEAAAAQASQLSSSTQQCQVLRERAEEAERQLAAQAEQLSNSQASLRTSQQESDAMRAVHAAELERLRTQLTNSWQAQAATEARLQASDARAGAAEAAVQRAQQAIDAGQREALQAAQRMHALEDEAERCAGVMVRLEAEVEHSRAEAGQLQQDLSAVRHEVAAARQGQQAAQQQAAQLAEQVQALSRQVEEAASQALTLQQQRTAAEAQCMGAQAEAARGVAELAAAQARAGAVATQVARLQAQLEQAQQQLEEARAAAAQQAEALEQLGASHRELRGRLACMSGQDEALAAQPLASLEPLESLLEAALPRIRAAITARRVAAARSEALAANPAVGGSPGPYSGATLFASSPELYRHLRPPSNPGSPLRRLPEVAHWQGEQAGARMDSRQGHGQGQEYSRSNTAHQYRTPSGQYSAPGSRPTEPSLHLPPHPLQPQQPQALGPQPHGQSQSVPCLTRSPGPFHSLPSSQESRTAAAAHHPRHTTAAMDRQAAHQSPRQQQQPQQPQPASSSLGPQAASRQATGSTSGGQCRMQPRLDSSGVSSAGNANPALPGQASAPALAHLSQPSRSPANQAPASAASAEYRAAGTDSTPAAPAINTSSLERGNTTSNSMDWGVSRSSRQSGADTITTAPVSQTHVPASSATARLTTAGSRFGRTAVGLSGHEHEALAAEHGHLEYQGVVSSAGLGSEDDAAGGMCAVCFSAPRNTVLNCGHLFCRSCSDRLQRCAMCRATVVSRGPAFV